MKKDTFDTGYSPVSGNRDESGYRSSVVYIGSVPLGGDWPIRIQSMTNTDTLDTNASVAQCIRIIEAGADYVRLTAQGIREAENLSLIKNELRKAGFETPLIADIHFNPAAAETAARIVEKVRINPGNYTDKRASFEKIEFTAKEYEEELEKIHTRLLPLINICIENKTVIRVGINHGSLSDRIMTRYGNTPAGMVQSALEFIRIFRAENFNNLVISMKSSDTAVMIEATRMLSAMMKDEGLAYPLHLGVTEAGEGEDGRVKSCAGIGALLAEGIGDTIRVSLSEDPEKEIPVAKKLADFFHKGINDMAPESPVNYISPAYKPDLFRRIQGPLVICDLQSDNDSDDALYQNAGYAFDAKSNKAIKTDASADLIIMKHFPEYIPENSIIALPADEWYEKCDDDRIFPLMTPEEYKQGRYLSDKLNIILTGYDFYVNDLQDLKPASSLIIFSFNPEMEPYAADHFLNTLYDNDLILNVILNPVFKENSAENLQIKASSILGRYLLDKRIAGISVTNQGQVTTKEAVSIAFSILQCTETRITRTMYISCPTCGRTKFNLQESVKKVREATGHLKGLKIAVMGCIVNGPGEMAGADYGYVGAGNGKVHIYIGTTAVLKNIPEDDAVKELLKIIEADINR